MRASALVTATLAALLPVAAFGQAATSTTGSALCASLAQAAADGMTNRIQADQQTIKPPTSVTQLSCLSRFFNGTGLNLLTSLVNPAGLLQNVEGQLCNAVNQAWQSAVGSAQCGLTLTGFNMGFGFGLGGGAMCPKLSFGGGGPPLGTASTGYQTGNGFGLYQNGQPTTPTGYPVIQSGGLY